MKKYDGRENIVKYYLIFFSVYLFFMILILALYLLEITQFTLLVVILAIVTMALVTRKATNRLLLSVLTVECDADKFHEMVFKGELFKRDALFMLLAEYYVGNFQQCVNICTEKLKDAKLKKHHFAYMTHLGSIYSLLGDRAELQYICDMFDREVESRADRDKIIAKYPVFEHYRNILKGDREAVLAALKRNVEKEWPDKMSRTNSLFSLGRALYIDGRPNEARDYLLQVAEQVPKTYFGRKAAEYVDKIDKNEVFDEQPTKILPETGVKIPRFGKNKKKIIFAILLTYVLCMLVVVFNAV